MLNIFTRLFGSRNQRLLRQYAERVRLANQFADALAAETAEGLRARTDALREQLAPARRSTRSCPRLRRPPARPRAAPSACGRSTCS